MIGPRDITRFGERKRNPFEVVSVGDVVKVKVIKVDLERGRIGLSMKDLS